MDWSTDLLLSTRTSELSHSTWSLQWRLAYGALQGGNARLLTNYPGKLCFSNEALVAVTVPLPTIYEGIDAVRTLVGCRRAVSWWPSTHFGHAG
jgi:hypothetical protein